MTDPTLFPAICSEPHTPADTKLDRSSMFEFIAADVFQHSPLGDVLNSLKNLSLAGNSQPNYVRFELEADDGEFRFPPATHFIATVEDLTNVLDYGSKDIDGMDDDADKEQGQDPPFTRRWTATSSYDVYIVDTPKKASDDDKEDPVANKPPQTQSKRRRPKRRSKSRRSKDSNTGTGGKITPDDAENNEDPRGVTSEQEEQENGRASPDEQALPSDNSEDDNYLPLSEDEVSLGDEDFIVPKEPSRRSASSAG